MMMMEKNAEMLYKSSKETGAYRSWQSTDTVNGSSVTIVLNFFKRVSLFISSPENKLFSVVNGSEWQISSNRGKDFTL